MFLALSLLSICVLRCFRCPLPPIPSNPLHHQTSPPTSKARCHWQNKTKHELAIDTITRAVTTGRNRERESVGAGRHAAERGEKYITDDVDHFDLRIPRFASWCQPGQFFASTKSPCILILYPSVCKRLIFWPNLVPWILTAEKSALTVAVEVSSSMEKDSPLLLPHKTRFPKVSIEPPAADSWKLVHPAYRQDSTKDGTTTDVICLQIRHN